ncbi:hypothetical protein ACF8LF_09830 [Pseudomonas putida]|uniref:Uncharacterized protein n=1 Tax=Pseudomonas monteilii TaxID=76759 RepID=A0A2N1IKA6_9PSED|nr:MULTISPECIES: hypothetical protein [Pseudomonas]EKT4471219.1 hypothetical protein [Pseudomonas putida]MDD2027246.1 hypothetical protein [Pseudomonas putida]MDX3744505.1 hypothetical protein [Pseudomonas sp.]ORL68730.1 hypothetical protein B7H19_14085 [Pseudomonas putida]PKI18688.1 hypothetical protein CXB65_25100 [Pseudomonas monteilii]
MSEFNLNAASGKLVHSSLLSFLPGVSREARDDILLANAFAQQVAWGDYNEGLEPDWFRNYWRNLAFLGFDGKLAPTATRPGPDRSSLAEQALAQVRQKGSAGHYQSAQSSLQALRNHSQTLTAFESRAVSKAVGRFQLLPCSQQSSGFIDMVLVHMEMSMKKTSKDFLFMQLSSEVKILDMRVEVIHFNLQGFREDYRKRAQASVDKQNGKAILELQL